MMRILHIDTGKTMRGGQQLLMLSARGLRTRGHDQTIACPAAFPLAKMAREEGFPVLAIDRSYWHSSQTIRGFLKTHPCGIVSAHDARAQTVSYLSTVGTRLARIANRQVTFDPRHAFIHRWKYTHTCDAVVATSQAVKDALVRQGIPAEHVQVIRGGIDFPNHIGGSEARASMRSKWSLGPDDFLIGHMAAFTGEKGQLDALDALAALLPKHPNLRMILAGDGPLRAEAQRRAVLGAQLPGYITADAEFYAGLDLFLANSTSEALGLAPLYAMAHEIPVIASNVGGLPEVAGKTGWLIPPSDTRALMEAIEYAIADPGRRRELGRLAREHARQFSSEVTIAETEALYLRLLQDKGATGPTRNT